MITDINEEQDTFEFVCTNCHSATKGKISALRVTGVFDPTVTFGACESCGAVCLGIAPLEFLATGEVPESSVSSIIGLVANKGLFCTTCVVPQDKRDKAKSLYKKKNLQIHLAHAKNAASGRKRIHDADIVSHNERMAALTPSARAEKRARVKIAQERSTQAKGEQVSQEAKLAEAGFPANVDRVRGVRKAADANPLMFSAETRKILAEAESAVKSADIATVQHKLDRLLGRVRGSGATTPPGP